MRIFVAGASGFVGTALVPALRVAFPPEGGHEVRAGMRKPQGDGAVFFDLDADDDGASCDAALADVDCVVFLVHGLDRKGFADWETATARRFAAACRRAGVRRLVYLGGVVPTHRTFLDAHRRRRRTTCARAKRPAPSSPRVSPTASSCAPASSSAKAARRFA